MPKPLIGITTRNGKDSDGHPLTALQHYIYERHYAGGRTSHSHPFHVG